MRSLSRRKLFRYASAFALSPWKTSKPDLVLYNGNILTMDPQLPHATAAAVSDGRFLAVGDDQDVLALNTGRSSKLDLEGKTVVPGFIDAHTHPCYAGLRHLRQIDCDLRSIADIQAAIRLRAGQTAPGQWVLGFKYDDTKTSDGRPLQKEDLDAAAPKHPVRIEHRGGHTAYVNSRALEIAGVTEATPDPAGGRYDRDPATGRLNGRVAEHAKDILEKFVPLNYSRDDYRQAVKLITKMMARSGVTSVHDAEGTPEDLRAYQDAHEANDLSVRVYCFLQYAYLERMVAAGIRTGLGDERVRIGGIKLVCDGSISERTARLSQPYVGRPKDFGILVLEEDDLYERARKAHAAGWQIGVHANGDVAIDMVLRTYERLQKESPRRDPRFRIEHCTVINDSIVRRMQAIGAIPTPFSTYVYYHGEKMREYGPERLNHMFAVRSFLDAGIRVTQASDYPPGPFEPMMALQSSVTRTDIKGTMWGPAQRISVEEALRVGTLHGAYASFEEKLKGSIEPGKLADLVVLGKNPLKEDSFSLVNIPIQGTMVGGRWVFQA